MPSPYAGPSKTPNELAAEANGGATPGPTVAQGVQLLIDSERERLAAQTAQWRTEHAMETASTRGTGGANVTGDQIVDGGEGGGPGRKRPLRSLTFDYWDNGVLSTIEVPLD